MNECSWPDLPERYLTALKETAAYLLSHCGSLIGVVASGTIIRGTPDASSDFDIYVVHAENWRQRIQKFFHGVPVEIFVNPPAMVERYFLEESKAGRPITAHMIGTGHVLYRSDPILDTLRQKARSILETSPEAPADLTIPRYMISSLFEDAVDVSRRDPTACRFILNQAVEQMLKHAFRKEGRYIPRQKDLPKELMAMDRELGNLAYRFYRTPFLRNQLDLAGRIADRTLGARGFFEWEGPREPVET